MTRETREAWKTLKRILKAEGWTLDTVTRDTGRDTEHVGCFVQDLDDNVVLSLMADNEYGDITPPRSLDDPCVYVYAETYPDLAIAEDGSTEDRTTEIVYHKRFASVREYLKWVETAEYVLPMNGAGPAANGWTEGHFG